MIDSENEEDESEGVSEFEATPAFKRAQPPSTSKEALPMRITRSQRKCSVAQKGGRKRTARQADLDVECLPNDDGQQRALRSTKKRKLN